jgi:S-adenosylmethionine:tRNA ribosyltransferase-isomerase
MTLQDFDYDLPPELIAQTPAPVRSASRLLHLDGRSGELRDLRFRQVIELVEPRDVLVLNDTRVIKARLTGRRASGGRVEVLVERVLAADEALVQIRASHAPRPAETVTLDGGVPARVVRREGGFFHLKFGCADVFDMLERHGAVPLPPYIEHAPDADDEARYQTVYARSPGAVAAPTAGLHFDAGMLDTLRARGITIAYVTLHVGAGTFQPVRSDDVTDHEMHSERYEVPPATADAIGHSKARGGRVLAVGTTTLRALESAVLPSPLPLSRGERGSANALEAAGSTPSWICEEKGVVRARAGETKLFITPGYRFAVVDRLVTNFHLPKSTLLMLVSAFAGIENIRRAYAHAIEQRYRFYSYGDAMLIERGTPI